MLGTQLLHYKVTAKLGEGGMGEVFLAEDLSLGRKVALKILSQNAATDPESKHRFLHEAKAQAMLSHANIATFYELAEVKGRTLIAMEYVDGKPLSEAVQERELHPTEALDIVIQIAAGLQAAHEKGVTHRDVKPANIMVTARGEVKITDFGLARWKGASTLTRKGTRLGTAYYMSPEQAEGKRVDHRADIFSVGVILYELLCRHRPFEGDSEAVVLYEILHSQPQPLARYCNCAPDQLEDIVRKCLERNPEDRYQSAADLVTDLRHVKQQIESGQIDVHHYPRDQRSNRFVRSTAALFAFLVVVGAFAVIPAARYQVLKVLGFDPLPPARHLAVIPFQDLSTSADHSVLVVGLAETVASKITQMEQFQAALRVIPAREVQAAGVSTVRDARAAFGATVAVTGSLQDIGSRLRVILNVVDAVDERQLRSTVLDTAPENLPALQDSISDVLARMLEVEMLPEQRRYLASEHPRNSDVYEHYLAGSGYLKTYASNIGNNTIIDVFKLDSAIALFREALDDDPDYAPAHAGLAEAYWRKTGALKESMWRDRAVYHGERAVTLGQNQVHPRVVLAQIYRSTGEYEKAEELLTYAVHIDSTAVEAQRQLVRTYEAMQQLDKAEGIQRNIVKARPDETRGYYDLELFYLRHGRYADADSVMKDIAAAEPIGFYNLNLVGSLHYLRGEIAEAKQMWQQSIDVAPNYLALSNLGAVSFMEQDYAAAAQLFQRALQVEDRDYRVWINLASAYTNLPEYAEKAIATYRRAVQAAEFEHSRNPRDGDVVIHMAECFIELADTTRALQLADSAQILAPENIDVAVRGGLLYEKIGMREKALDLVSKALQSGYPVAQLQALPDLEELLADARLQLDTATKP